MQCLYIVRNCMKYAQKSPQYDSLATELLTYLQKYHNGVKDFKAAKSIQLIVEATCNYDGVSNFLPPKPKKFQDITDYQLWVQCSICLIKPELIDEFINVIDLAAENKSLLSTISYVAMISANHINIIKDTQDLATLKLKWTTKLLNLTLARTKNNPALAKYYWNFVLLPFCFFQNPSFVDFGTIDYSLVRAGGYLRLSRAKLPHFQELEQCIQRC